MTAVTTTDRWVAAWEAASANGASVAPDWVQALRRAALDRFVQHGFPTRREEAWRFTSTEALERIDFLPAPPATVDRATAARFRLAGPGALAVTVNGRYQPDLADLGDLPSGVTVLSLADALANRPDLVRPHLDNLSGAADSPLATLATAFVRDGIVVHVAARTLVERPLELLHLAAPADMPVASHPRTLVILEPGASLTLVETFAGVADDSVYWTNAISESVVGEDARLETHRIQRESPQAFHTAAIHSTQGRASHHQILSFVFGGSLTRIDAGAVLDGEGAECVLNGLIVAQGRQHVDHHTTLDHAKPHCNSWEFVNGIYDDESRGVFTGRIIVRPGAQKTDSKQTNNNLLLSPTARADSQPQLEIYADDVRCTHGATLGPIDEQHLFYLQSRGLSRAAARNLLTWGFGAEILNYVTDDGLRAALDVIVHARLDDGARRRGEA